MTSMNELAAFFFVQTNKDADINDIIPDDNRAVWIAYATRYYSAYVDFINRMQHNLYNQQIPLDKKGNLTIENAIQWHFYEVGKIHYGNDKESLRNWFRDIYMILFRSNDGPRIGQFAAILGLEEFCSLLTNKTQNPFCF